MKTSESFIPRKSSAAPRYGAEINGKMRLSTLSIELVIDGGELLLRDAVTSVELRTSNAKWGRTCCKQRTLLLLQLFICN